MKKKNHSTLLAILLLVGFVAPLSSAHAALIPIVNASFELALGQAGGWTKYDPNGIGFVDTYPPEAKTLTVDDFYNPPGPIPPDGTEVGYVFLGSDFGAGKVGLQQTLTSNLMANTRYDLSVAVGNLQSAFSPRSLVGWNFYGFPGYEIQLLAGGTLLENDFDSIVIAEGDFATVSLSFTTGNSHTLLGQALGVRLINLNNDLLADEANNCVGNFCDIDWNSEVDFDNVQLSVSAVPIPAAVWLFGTALIGFVGMSRRRKVA